jgi:hypothetical protein
MAQIRAVLLREAVTLPRETQFLPVSCGVFDLSPQHPLNTPQALHLTRDNRGL